MYDVRHCFLSWFVYVKDWWCINASCPGVVKNSSNFSLHDCLTPRMATLANKSAILCAAPSVLFFVCSCALVWAGGVLAQICMPVDLCLQPPHTYTGWQTSISLAVGRKAGWTTIGLLSSSSSLFTACMISYFVSAVHPGSLLSMFSHFLTFTSSSEEKLVCLSSADSRAVSGSPSDFSLEMSLLLAAASLTWLALKSFVESLPWSLWWNCSTVSVMTGPEESLRYTPAATKGMSPPPRLHALSF